MSTQLHLASLLNKKGYPDRIIAGNALLYDTDIQECRNAIKVDRDAFFINALLSYAGSITAIRKDNYSWAFIQSYYCIFYLAKVLLAGKDRFVYYVKGKPYRIKLSYGEHFTKEKKGNSHEVALRLFTEEFQDDSSLYSEIDGENSITWFNHKREEINYRLSPMPDPTPPAPLFKYNNDIRKWLAVYENELLYAFDAEHCYMAFTTNLLKRVTDSYRQDKRQNNYVTDALLLHLKRNIADEKGPLPLVKRLEDLKK